MHVLVLRDEQDPEMQWPALSIGAIVKGCEHSDEMMVR